MGLDIFLLVLAIVLVILGTIGCVVPILPGAPLAWFGLLAAFLCSFCDISVVSLVITGILSALVSVLDNLAPIYLTSKTGGTKWGSWGVTIGLILGFFAGPLGIIICPFLGALAGELLYDSKDKKRAFKSACGAFLGFLTGIGIKLACCFVIIICLIRSFF